jgi:ADP-ribosylglycohydrolase
MAQAAAARCMGSKANGSLMRCMALAVWGRRLPAGELASWARRDSGLSHPNPACTDAVAAYVIALAHLLESPGDHEGAVARAEEWAARESSEVASWLALSRSGSAAPFHPQDGYVKIAFTHAFMHLGRRSSFTEALRATLAGGGDTDTNACIVGGLMGGLHSVGGIPEPWQAAVLECNTALGRPRPEWLHPRQLPELVDTLLG